MISCIIIDDEPLARQLLQGYIDEIPMLNCIAICKSAMEAFAVLQSQKVDLMFLDINMPGITGLNFLKSLNDPPAVIFTTAYAEHAVEAFELEALDYLLKPITPERFLKSIQKYNSKKAISSVSPQPNSTSIFLKVNKRLVKINFSEILYIEALGDYLKVITKEETLVTHSTINKIAALLPDTMFIRIHRSFICATAAIKYLEGNQIQVSGGMNLPVGATYKDALLSRMQTDI